MTTSVPALSSHFADTFPELWGGSADLAGSNNTTIESANSFNPSSRTTKKFSADPYGRVLHFGIREHAAAAIVNGITIGGLTRAYMGTFLTFSDYMRPAVRLAALMGTPSTYVWTHDSIGLGEDGPTHQPVEQLPSLRAIPGLIVLRPADANEVTEAWRVIAPLKHQPVVLVLTRQAVPTLDRTKYAPASGLAKGAYVLSDSKGTPDVILIGTGSEVQLCLQAQEQLEGQGVKARVVSMPSWELFEQQDEAYREQVLPSSVRARVAVEKAAAFGWERFVGLRGAIVGMRSFGASAPLKALQQKFGFTVDNVVKVAREVIERAKQ